MENHKNRKGGRILNRRNLLSLFLVLADIASVAISGIVALVMRFDLNTDQIPAQYITNLNNYILLDAALLPATLLLFGLYFSMWTYASIMEALQLICGLAFYEIADFGFKEALGVEMPKSFYFMQLMLLIVLCGGTRFANRVRILLKKRYSNRRRSKRMLVVGAGDAGRMLIREVLNNSDDFDGRIVAAVDDDRNKRGKTIAGVPVLGAVEDIEMVCYKQKIDEIVIAIPSARRSVINKIVEECQKTSCPVKVLPKVASSMSKDFMKSLRPLSYEDFLGRDEIVVNSDEITAHINGKVVLVTGGGGSIGSELCRQIAKAAPAKLIILDIYENNTYDIQQELLRNVPGVNLVTIIRSVRDYAGMEKVFAEYKPQLVFHAAAHKHVPLMEFSPNEAVKNNCRGTWNTCDLAAKYGVERFVLISSDKAVRPTNVMGATKRICEMIVQAYARKKNCQTEFVAVRFGNVLGSNGSVIPLFLKQIENGGPVTVTHKDMTRYFMTIPEAVSLILQAGVYAKGGEIFILDMGKPVKIYDLAEKLIRMKGYEPGEDIEIKITGLRPGEKIFEELLMEEEGLQNTPNKLIHIGKPIMMDDRKFFEELEEVCDAADENTDEIKDIVAKVVGTYKVDKRS